jgi:hypothetical protein
LHCCCSILVRCRVYRVNKPEPRHIADCSPQCGKSINILAHSAARAKHYGYVIFGSGESRRWSASSPHSATNFHACQQESIPTLGHCNVQCVQQIPILPQPQGCRHYPRPGCRKTAASPANGATSTGKQKCSAPGIVMIFAHANPGFQSTGSSLNKSITRHQPADLQPNRVTALIQQSIDCYYCI